MFESLYGRAWLRRLFPATMNPRTPTLEDRNVPPTRRERLGWFPIGRLAPGNKGSHFAIADGSCCAHRGSRLPHRLEIKSNREIRRTIETQYNIWNRTLEAEDALHGYD